MITDAVVCGRDLSMISAFFIGMLIHKDLNKKCTDLTLIGVKNYYPENGCFNNMSYEAPFFGIIRIYRESEKISLLVFNRHSFTLTGIVCSFSMNFSRAFL